MHDPCRLEIPRTHTATATTSAGYLAMSRLPARLLITAMKDTRPTRQRFAPLPSTGAACSTAPKLEGIIFDVDGTLTQPQPWMFVKIRQALGIPNSTDILEFVAAMEVPEHGMQVVMRAEQEAMRLMQIGKGVGELMAWLEAKSVRKGILTRNYM
jgi:hypothetical protein